MHESGHSPAVPSSPADMPGGRYVNRLRIYSVLSLCFDSFLRRPVGILPALTTAETALSLTQIPISPMHAFISFTLQAFWGASMRISDFSAPSISSDENLFFRLVRHSCQILPRLFNLLLSEKFLNSHHSVS